MDAQLDKSKLKEKAPQSPKLALTFIVLLGCVLNIVWVSSLKFILYNLLLEGRALVNMETPPTIQKTKVQKCYVCYRILKAQYITLKELWILIKIFLKYHTIFGKDMTVVLPFFSRYTSSCYPSLELARALRINHNEGKTVNGNNVWIKLQGWVWYRLWYQI